MNYFEQFIEKATVKELEEKILQYRTFNKYLIRAALEIEAQYTDTEVKQAWMDPHGAPDDLSRAICLIWCDDFIDLCIEWYEDALTARLALAEQRRDEWSENICEEEIFNLRHIAGTESFEVFLEALPDQHSDTLSIPEEVYEYYVYLQNDYYTRSDYEDMIEREVF